MLHYSKLLQILPAINFKSLITKYKAFPILLFGFLFFNLYHLMAQDVPRLEWVSQMGGTGFNTGEDIFVDGSGNVYTTGLFWGTVDFDPGPGTFNLTSAGTSDIFITKQDPSGTLIWAVRMGGTGNDDGFSITVDLSGNVLTTGHFRNTVDFDPGPGVFNLSAGFYDSFISKLDASGNFVWAVKFGEGSNDQNGYSIGVDAAGNVYTTGSYINTVDFDPGAGVFNLSSSCNDGYVSKLSPNGDFIWAKRLGGTGCNEEGNSIVVDATGNVFIAGQFNGTSDFDPNAGTFNLTSAGSNDIFICMLDATGSFVWAKQLGGTLNDQVGSMVMDDLGNLLITGNFTGTADFDPGAGVFSLTSSGGQDVFVCKLNNLGDFIWAKNMGGTLDDFGHDIMVDPLGNAYTTGEFRDNADFDPGSGTFILNGGTVDGFVSKLDASGNFAWAIEIGGSGFDYGYGITVDALENVYTTGAFYSSNTDFDPTPCPVLLATLGSGDIFVQKLNKAIPLPPAHSITSFTPASGPVGTTVTLTGTNFSSTAANNLVTFFNNRTATVTASTPTSITTTVPASSANGQISVTVNCITVQSATNFTVTASPTQDFITQWNLATTGSGATQLSFGTATSGTVNYTWQQLPTGASGSGSWSGSTLTITGLPASAIIRLQIAPTNFQRINVSSGLDEDRLTLVEQWGTTAWTSMQDAFRGCTNLQITATDVPNLSGVTDMSSMFESCRNLNSPSNMGTWNTSTVTNMTFMFYDATVFNQDIGAWNTSAVTNMNTMFSEALAFNQDIGSWNTASVTDMSDMFGYTTAFNQDISGWNTGAVTDMSFMFRGAGAFNQDISSWNTAAVTNMRSMFRLAIAFNQNLGAWTLNSVVDVRNLFDDSGMNCSNYSATLMGWSANPSTPNGRTLGAAGRQYGTNAVSARTNLDVTKGWTITGDTPSGVSCSVATTPTITSFTPTSGPISTTVIITGTNFSTTPSNNTVMFNGTTAVVTASSATSITCTVPSGATTGKISVTVSGNTATSASDFTVTAGSTINITTQPSFTYACENTTATFSVDASGTTNITYRWQKYDGSTFTDLTDGAGYAGTATKTLSINTSITGFGGNGEYQCRINGDLAPEVFSNSAQLTINGLPSPPDVVGATGCSSPTAVSLTASGGSDGDYSWYDSATGGVVLGTNGSFTTPPLATTTTYYVSLKDTFCESVRVPVVASINILSQPIITANQPVVNGSVTTCSTTNLTLNAPAGFSSYNWSNGATTQQIIVTASGSYSVTITDTGGCVSPVSNIIVVTIIPAPCSNQPPVISATPLTTIIGSSLTINLLDLISDADNNLVSVSIVQQPTSAATTSITNNVLEINYTGLGFTGIDQLTIQACDLFNECVQQQLSITVVGEIEIFNAISPNNDGFNDSFTIQYIDLIPETQNNTVTIYNRWGSKVFEVSNYNNTDRVFKGLNDNGNELPSGTYFYRIVFTRTNLSNSEKEKTGYLILKR